MKDFFRFLSLTITGIFAAMIVYPCAHELGHFAVAQILGVKIENFSLLPNPFVTCSAITTNPKDFVFIGFGGLVFPTALTLMKAPKKFHFWYLWFSVKLVCILSFLCSLWTLIFYGTKLEIPTDDMSVVMQVLPEYRILYIFIVVVLFAITLCDLLRIKPIQKCMRYFDC